MDILGLSFWFGVGDTVTVGDLIVRTEGNRVTGGREAVGLERERVMESASIYVSRSPSEAP